MIPEKRSIVHKTIEEKQRFLDNNSVIRRMPDQIGSVIICTNPVFYVDRKKENLQGLPSWLDCVYLLSC